METLASLPGSAPAASAPSRGGWSGPRIPLWLSLGLIAAAVALAGSLAVRTRFNVHPDEYVHVDAFRYFETRGWPPDLGSDEVIYSPQGWSRVYTGEIVYVAYGKIGGLVRRLHDLGPRRYLLYRFLNVALLGATLAALFAAPRRWFSPAAMACALLCLPQAIYVYSYANSDAWALSAAIALFLAAASLIDAPTAALSLKRLAGIGALAGLLLTSKTVGLVSLPLPAALLGFRLCQAVRRREVRSRLGILPLVAILALAAAAVAAPLRIVYPATQGDFRAAVETMREQKALEGFKPSRPSYRGYRLASRGETLRHMLADGQWLALTLQSFYGLYGPMAVQNPPWLYGTAGAAAAFALALAGAACLRHWRLLHPALRLCLCIAPTVVALNLACALGYSLHIDFQPQGRYLFPSLIPLALPLAAPIFARSGRLRAALATLFVILLGLGLFSLLLVALRSPALTG